MGFCIPKYYLQYFCIFECLRWTFPIGYIYLQLFKWEIRKHLQKFEVLEKLFRNYRSYYLFKNFTVLICLYWLNLSKRLSYSGKMYQINSSIKVAKSPGITENTVWLLFFLRNSWIVSYQELTISIDFKVTGERKA